MLKLIRRKDRTQRIIYKSGETYKITIIPAATHPTDGLKYKTDIKINLNLDDYVSYEDEKDREQYLKWENEDRDVAEAEKRRIKRLEETISENQKIIYELKLQNIQYEKEKNRIVNLISPFKTPDDNNYIHEILKELLDRENSREDLEKRYVETELNLADREEKMLTALEEKDTKISSLETELQSVIVDRNSYKTRFEWIQEEKEKTAEENKRIKKEKDSVTIDRNFHKTKSLYWQREGIRIKNEAEMSVDHHKKERARTETKLEQVNKNLSSMMHERDYWRGKAIIFNRDIQALEKELEDYMLYYDRF